MDGWIAVSSYIYVLYGSVSKIEKIGKKMSNIWKGFSPIRMTLRRRGVDREYTDTKKAGRCGKTLL